MSKRNRPGPRFAASRVTKRVPWGQSKKNVKGSPGESRMIQGGVHMFAKSISRALLGAAAALSFALPAAAEVPEIRLVQQFSIGYLQLNVMEHNKLIEKHAKLMACGQNIGLRL